MKSSIILFGAGIIALALPAAIGAGDDSWNNLGHINEERVYSFALRSGEWPPSQDQGCARRNH
jgi:hypothetical protein